jgi:hypothetical protein
MPFLLTIALFGFGFLFWAEGVVVSLILMFTDGALRKWAFPQYADFLYWAKDILLAAAYLRFFGSRLLRQQRLIPAHPLNGPIALMVFWGLAEAFNPNLPSVRVGLFGVKAYFFYVPFLYVLPELVRTKRALQRGLVVFALLSMPASILGIVQFFSPLDSPLVSYLQWEDSSRDTALATMGMFPRVSGTFSFVSGYSAYLFFVDLLLIALLNLRRSLPWALRALLFVALLLGLVALVMTGSRLPVAVLAALTLLFLLLLGRVTAALRTFVALAVVAVVGFQFFPEAPEAFWQRTSATDDVEERVLLVVSEPLSFLGMSLPWGAGIGSTHQAARFLMRDDSYDWVPTQEFEDEPGRIMLELGPVGFALFYGLKVLFLWQCWRLLRRLHDTEFRVLAAFAFCVQAGFVLLNTVFNVTAAMCLWSASSLLLLLPGLAARDDPAAKARAA